MRSGSDLTGMSVQALTWVLEHSEARLGARNVMFAIANRADEHGDNAWPSVATIAKWARLSERQVQRILPDLVRLGELEIRENAGPHGTHIYRIVPMTQPRLDHRRGDRLSPPTSCQGGDISGGQGVTFSADRGDISGQNDGENVTRNVLATLPDTSKDTGPRDRRAARSAEFDARFARLREIYPRRSGHQRWPDARKHIRARLREGHTWSEILDGAERYAAWCRATGKTGTETVLQAATFCGENLGFLEAWDTPVRSLGDAVDEAWQRVVVHIRGAYRNGQGVDGGPIDVAVRSIGGYRALAFEHEGQLPFARRRFAKAYADAIGTVQAGVAREA